jgi:U3 small nucleolar RNA-associated protein 13
LIGFSDEILDIAYLGPKDAYLAVATNSPDIKLYQVSDMNCSLLKGHTDIVVSLATTPSNLCLFASGSKVGLCSKICFGYNEVLFYT